MYIVCYVFQSFKNSLADINLIVGLFVDIRSREDLLQVYAATIEFPRLTSISWPQIPPFYRADVPGLLSFINRFLEPENYHFIPRDEYKEFLELAKIILGGRLGWFARESGLRSESHWTLIGEANGGGGSFLEEMVKIVLGGDWRHSVLVVLEGAHIRYWTTWSR